MLFNSLEFLLFLPIVFMVYWFVVNRNLWLQNLFVVFVSYVFYGWWDWMFLLLIALTSFCSWLSGVWMGERDGAPVNIKGLRGHRLFVMTANVVLNLVILGYFKYYNFFFDSLITAFAHMGITLHAQTLKVILPVGISFYTFQALSYSIDVYRGHIKPTRDIVAFFAYVSFFPQLVAGPIERATNLLPQFLSPRTFNYPQAVDGCRQMLWGFFKKMVVADNCALLANLILDGKTPNADTGVALWLGMLCFTFQIYCDFSGYSDIAIGCSRLFGIGLMRNFAYPYFSRDIAEFWRRWHISLSTWFRDYLYVPLGGSRGNKRQQTRNTFITFMVSGFWHGANWTFMIWGLVHAAAFLPLLLIGKNRKHTDVVAEGRMLPSIKEACQMGATFLLVVVAWVFFRAPNVNLALSWIHNMLTLKGGLSFSGIGLTNFMFFSPWILLLVATEWVNRRNQHGLVKLPRPRWARMLVYIILASVVLLEQGRQQTFIYFQF